MHSDLVGLFASSGCLLNFKLLVHYFHVVECFNGFFGSTFICIFEECVTFVKSRIDTVFDQVEGLKFTERSTDLADFCFTHAERDAAHKDTIVFLLFAAFSISSDDTTICRGGDFLVNSNQRGAVFGSREVGVGEACSFDFCRFEPQS